MNDQARDIVAQDVWTPPTPAAPTTEVEAMLALIERVARDPQSDIEKLERLVAMRERLETREAERQFNAAMAAVQAEIPIVLRDRTNTQTNSKYATLERIAKAIMPIVAKHGFSVSFGMDEPKQPDCCGITAIVSNGGYSRNYRADVPIDAAGLKGVVNKTKTHAFGSTASYGRRYLLCMIFNVATGDDDDGNTAGNAKETISEDQAMQLRELIEATNSDQAKLLAYLKIESVADIPADKFDWVCGLLKRKQQ